MLQGVEKSLPTVDPHQRRNAGICGKGLGGRLQHFATSVHGNDRSGGQKALFSNAVTGEVIVRRTYIIPCSNAQKKVSYGIGHIRQEYTHLI